ncbi:PPOX class F420-dependent oxidoreductase [Nocardia uniformis]|uniref:PPOX class F420-dependent oxidoreductase n=1 Tax=Nocardia uniformis TaxID=53432 RepID=A0A849BXK1_9NOCA|nr:PPOX class F420-dependent oxidoreductase [Nocardia uniformis]NNH69010.1 PPOX class F420-dependent oxidoreductase [Nocardia uniformis]
MPFTEIERTYLSAQRLARLATVNKDNHPNQVAVGFRLNPDGTIDIGGPNPNAQRYRNVRANANVSLVVDDMTPDDPSEVKPGWGRGVEIRGTAEILTVDDIPVAPDWFSHEIIRIHPRRVHSWHIDPADPDGGSRNVESVS